MFRSLRLATPVRLSVLSCLAGIALMIVLG